MPMPNFSRIIEEVRRRPELWRKGHVQFTNREHHKKVWRKIALKLNSDEIVVKKRWKHLKDHYRKELKKTSCSDETPESINSWTYFRAMEFIKDELLHSQMRRDVNGQSSMRSNQSESDDGDHDQSGADTAQTKLRQVSRQMTKMATLIEKHIEACEGDTRKDPDYMFLMSILPSVKKLSDVQNLVFRGKINEWLLETMTQNEYNVQCDADSKYFLPSQLEVECQDGECLT